MYELVPERCCVAGDHAATPTKLCLQGSPSVSSAQIRHQLHGPCNSTNVHTCRINSYWIQSKYFQLTTTKSPMRRKLLH